MLYEAAARRGPNDACRTPRSRRRGRAQQRV